MAKLSQWARQLASRLRTSTVESAHYSKYNAPMIGLLGLIGFPLYYYVWEYMFPQPYESLALRLTGAAVCTPLIFYRHWPERWHRAFAGYWLVSLTYTLPFLFTYMLLRNELSLVWSMSTMAALFLLVLAVYDWLLVVMISIIGTALAWIAFAITSDTTVILSAYLEQLPIYCFVIFAGSIFNYTSHMVKEEKLDAYSAVGRNIAHELRTPLLGIRAAMAAISHYLPDLIDSHEQALKAQLPVRKIRTSRYEKLRTATDRIDEEITYSNTIIDMLLLSAGQTTLRSSEFAIYSGKDTVSQALQRYPFNSERERNLVTWEQRDDFEYFGSDLLVSHILFNLIKNALYSVLKAGKGDVVISTRKTREGFLIIVRDTGTGIGLSFCKLAMESFSGDITCRSKLGEYTEFTLMFPGITK